MGNDGGSIPTRRELVRSAAKAASTQQIKETRAEALDYAWKTCSLSHKPLREPVVSDAAGKLYSKDAVVEHLLAQTSAATAVEESKGHNGEKEFDSHVKSLRDVVEVRFQYEEADSEMEAEAPRWVCPITNKFLGPAVKAVYLVPCGHAFSEIAIKETANENQCLQCNEAYDTSNIVTILPSSPSDVEKSQARISRLRDQGLSHTLKKIPDKSKKRKKDKTIPPASDSNNATNSILSATQPPIDSSPQQQPSTEPLPPASSRLTDGIKNSDTASLTARVIAEQDLRTKRRKVEDNENVKSLFSSGDTGQKKRADFMTRGYSIPVEARR